MRRIVVLVFVISTLGLASCGKPLAVKPPVKNLHAPGQMKKLTGSKSAAPYAPGQQKKSNKK